MADHEGVLIIGGGPAGLMAAEASLAAGQATMLVDAKPSFGRKFLMAGKSGLNLTRMEDLEPFVAAYGDSSRRLSPLVKAMGPNAVREWTEALGQSTFVGSTRRLFPKSMKASPLLRAWLSRLDDAGLIRHTRWRWQGWEIDGHRFDTPDGPVTVTANATVLALGGASWKRLGSDGLWTAPLNAAGVETAPFQASNAGLSIAWSPHMTAHFGKPLKSAAFRAGDILSRGEATISSRGLEGGGVYPLAPAIRASAAVSIDLLPDLDQTTVATRLARPRGKASLSTHLRKTLKLSRPAQAMLTEFARPLPTDPQDLARLIKAVPLSHQGLRPLDEAISTTGGILWEALDDALMLKARPGTFCAGEMINWDAPTGGYLLTACFATGRHAGRSAAAWSRR